jgi:ribonuclease E
VKPAGTVEAVVAAVATEKVVVTELQPATDAPELAAQAAAKIETVAPIVSAEEGAAATEAGRAQVAPAAEPAPAPAPVETAPAAAAIETVPVAPVEAAAVASPEDAAAPQAAPAETAPAAQPVPEAATPSVEEVPAAVQPVPVIREDVIQAAVPAHEAALPVAAIPVETAPAAPPAPVEAKPRQAAPHANGLSPEALQPMLANAGLVWVNTDADKLRAAQEAAAQVVKPPRAPRERKPLPPVDSTPMQQVETVKHVQ